MKASYFTARQEEHNRDLGIYNEKLEQFEKGLHLMHDDPRKAYMLMGDAFAYFDAFAEKYSRDEDEDKTGSEKSRSRRSKGHYTDFTKYRDVGPDRDTDDDGGSTITWYEIGEDIGRPDIDKIFDLFDEGNNYGFGTHGSPEAEREAFRDFVDNDLDMSKFKNYMD